MDNISNIVIPKNDLEKLISAHDGDMVLVYVYSRLHDLDPDNAARDLIMTRASIDAAIEKLNRLELLTKNSPSYTSTREDKTASTQQVKCTNSQLERAEELPQYTSNDLVIRAREDQGFAYAIEEAQRSLGRTLSSNDMQVLFGIYDHLGLPTEVIMLLINFCIERCEKKYGNGRKPTFKTIEKEAWKWYNRQILTLESADNYIANYNRMFDLTSQFAECVNIRGRTLTATELKHINSWIDMGFDTDAISVAYDRTVTNTGKLTWAYINKILNSWHEKGIHTVAEINEKDAPYAGKQKKSSKNSNNTSDPDEIKKSYDKLKKLLDGK